MHLTPLPLLLLAASLMLRRPLRGHLDIDHRRRHSRRNRLHRVIQSHQRRHTVVVHRCRRSDHCRMNAVVMKEKRSCQHQRQGSPHGNAKAPRLTN